MLFSLMLSSCQPEEVILPYETLVQVGNVVIVNKIVNPHDTSGLLS